MNILFVKFKLLNEKFSFIIFNKIDQFMINFKL